MRLVAALAAAAIYSAAGQSLEPGYADINGGSLIRVHLALNVSEDAASELRCRFSGHAVPAVLHPDRSSVSCMAPPAPDGRPGSVGVSVTAMNRPLGSELMLAYYDSVSLPRLSSVTPRAAHAGKPTEVRIRGSNFAPVAPGEMKCRFRGEGLTNASFVSHEEMLCLSPLAADDTDDLSRTVPLQLSLDGDLFSLMGEVEFTIESHLPSNVTAIVPSHGPTDGHTEIEVHGVGFHPFIEDGEEVPIACHFHNDNRWHREVAATFVSSHLVKCSTPSYTETDSDGWHGDVALSVGPMGQQHGTWHEESNEVLFGYYILGGRPLPLSLSPAAGDFGHPPALSLEGQGFSPTGDDLACIYGDPSGDTTTAASFISAHEVHCAAPHTLPLGAIEVSATTDGGVHIGPDPGMHPNYKPPQLVVYDASKPPEVTGVSPTWAPINGGTEVVVRGTNLAPTHRLACVFERNGVAAATFLNETAVSCPTPLNARVGATLLSLTLDRATLSPGAVPVDLVDTDSPPRVLMVVPPLSTFHGGEMLTLWGDNFAPHLSTVCVFTIEPEDEGEERFTAASVAEFRSANKIKCESPFSGDARGTARVQVWNADVPRGTDVVRAALRTLEEAQTRDQGPRLSTTAGRLTYYNPDELPRVRSVTPDFAPASNDYGGHHVTVRGSNFAPVGNTLLCEFGETGTETFVASVHASFINGSALGCHIASNLIPGDIGIRVSLDGGKSFSLESARFTYYEPQHPPIVTVVSPREIDLADPPPHLVEIRGQNFAPTANLSCGFGAAREVGANAHFDSFHQIKCEVPPLAWEHNLVDTTTDGVRWSGQSMMWDPNADEMLGDSGIKKVPHPGHIVIFNSSKTGLLESVFPTALKIGTAKLLTIRGYNLYSKAKSGRCTFTPHDRSFGVDVPEPTAATAIDAEHVQCEAPHATEPQTLSLSIELDGHAGGFKAAPGPLGDGHLTLSFYDPSYPPGIDDSAPHFGERHEPSVVRLFGHNFAPAYAYKDDDRIHHAGVLMCRFGKLHSFTHATFVHSHAVLCPTPYTEHLGHVELGYSYDHGQSWVPTPEHVNYTFIDSDFPPEIKSVTPNVDMFDGGALLTVRGDNFYPEVDDSALHLARQHMEHGHQVLAGSLGGFVRGSNTQPLFGRRLLELASRLTFADPPAREMTPPHADPSGGWGAVLHADMSAEEHTSRYEKLLRRDAHGAVDYSKGNELVPAAEAHPSSGRQLSRRELAMVPQQFCLLSKPNGWPLAMSAATFISDTEVRCESPRVEDKSVADVNFHLISKNGVRSLPLPFTLWDPDTNPAVTSVFPQGIPFGTAASALVQVRGSGFAPIGEPMCRFGDDGEPTPATIVRSTLALCKTPPDSGGAARSVPVRVTRDGANSESDEDTLFSFYDPTSLPSTVAAVPPYADRHGGQTVVVSGAGIQPLGAELLCRVGGEDGIEVPAEFISMEKVRCMLPPAPAEWDGEEAWASVCVVHAGSAPAGCTAHVEFYDPHSPPVLQKLAPRLLPLHSETDEPLHVFGLNMAPMGDKLLCSFDGGSPVPASFVKGDEVKCTAPDSSEAKAIYVSVSIDGGQQFSEPLPFVRFDKDRPPMLKSLDPLYAPLHTPVEVTLYGDNFAPTPDFRCVFGHLEPTPATFISPKEARCFSPDIVHDPYTAYVKAELMPDGPWSNSKPFTMYDDTRPPHVKNFSKHWGSVDGGEITDLFGDDFAPTEHLRTRFGAEDSQVVNYGPATFVTVNHIKVEIPRYHEPATVEVYATNDGEEYGSGRDWYDHKPVMYTYYNPREPPKVYSMAPKYGHHAVGTVVTINGYNFAPIPERLNVRWGSLGEDQATFVESGTVLAMSILPSAEVLSLSVPVQVAPTTMLVPPEAEWITEDLFTYWQPYLPPGLSSASPTEGACFSGGRKVEDTRTSDLTEVSNEETVEVEGFNFVPAEHLSCVYHHVGGSGMGGVDDYQVFLPGIFVRYDKIRCPIPTIRYADDGTSLSRIMWLTVTNDGITYRYSHTKFTFTGECRPTKFTTIVFGLITGLLVLLLGACLLGGGGGGKSQPQTRDFRFQQLDDDEPAPPQTTGPSRLDQIKAGTAGAMGSMANMAKAGAQKAKAYSEQLKQPPAPAPPPAQSTPAATRQFAAAPAPPPPAPPPQQYTPAPAPAPVPAPVPAPAPARVPSVPASPARDPEARLKQQGTLTVHVKEAKNLVGRDKANLSDPYVAIKIKGQKTWKSSVFKRNCNPQFDDRFVAKGTLGDFVNCLMLLKVIDRNTKELKEGYGGEKSDSLGDLSFKLDGLRTRNRVPYENVDLDMTESGTISLIVTWEADEQSLSI